MHELTPLIKEIISILHDEKLPPWKKASLNVDFAMGSFNEPEINILLECLNTSNNIFINASEKLTSILIEFGKQISNENREQGELTEYELIIPEKGEASLSLSFNRHQE